MKKTRVFIVVLVFVFTKQSIYPRFGFLVQYSPATFIKYADIGMSVGGSIFFDNTYLNLTSVRLSFSGEYIFYNYENTQTSGGNITLPGMPDLPDLPDTGTKETKSVREFIDGYAVGITGEFLRDFGGYYYSFAAGFGLGISLAFIGGNTTVNGTIKFPFRISYPINQAGVRMYIEIAPVINIPMVYSGATNFFDASGYIAFPISVGFRF